MGGLLAGAVVAGPAAGALTPDTTITDAPPWRVAADTVTYAFAADQPGAAFTCSVDYGPPTPCTSPTTVSGLADGAHTLLVAAAGDDSPAEARVVVDTVAPDTVITAPVPARTNVPTLTLEFAASESGPTRCSLDGAPPMPCVSPVTLTGLSFGAHTFSVAAEDLVGNLDASPATVAWTLRPIALVGPARVRASARGRVTLTLAALDEAATGRIALRRAGTPAAAPQRLIAPAGARTHVTIPLGLATRRSLARRGTLALRATVTLASGARTSRTLTVVAPAHRR